MGAGSNEANRRLREMQYERQFRGAPAPKPPRVVPPVEGVVRGAGPAPAMREGGQAVPQVGDKPVSPSGDKKAPNPAAVSPDGDLRPDPVSRTGDLSFADATDALLVSISREDIADRLGVSVATVKQARLPVEAHAHRPPPKGWRSAVLAVAEEMAEHYRRLADQIRAQAGNT